MLTGSGMAVNAKNRPQDGGIAWRQGPAYKRGAAKCLRGPRYFPSARCLSTNHRGQMRSVSRTVSNQLPSRLYATEADGRSTNDTHGQEGKAEFLRNSSRDRGPDVPGGDGMHQAA